MPSNDPLRKGRPLTVWGRAWASALLLASSPTRAATDDNGLPRQFFDTRADRQFGDVRVPMRAYLREPYVPRHRGVQHFCVVGYVDEDGDRYARVHWREGRELIGWSGVSDPEWRRDSIKMSHDKLDLTKDVVATDADINSSTYLVTRAWVAQVLADCAARGTRYTLRP